MKELRTVSDFWKYLERTLNNKLGMFFSSSASHLALWRELNDLGWEKRTAEIEHTINVDATAPLSDREWDALNIKFQALLSSLTESEPLTRGA